MKKRFLDYSLGLIRKYRIDIDEVKLDEIRYGLEGIYLTVTKSVVIFSLALILGIFRETILLLLFFNILRTTGFGLHASKSWICLLSSCLIFILFPFVSKLIIIPTYIKSIAGIIAIIAVYNFAPADTKKRPIISPKIRQKYKFITTVNCIILAYVSIIISDQIISNLIIFGIYTEVIFITPFTYRLFNLSYNNYLSYSLD